jgi:uncharacterized protein (TIGR02186 family)
MRCAVALSGVVLALGGPLAGAHGQGRDRLDVTPSRAPIGMFYDGVRLTVTQEVESGTDVAVVVTGPTADLPLRRQTRVWHVFWAPGEAVTFKDVPAVYVLQTSAPLAALAPDSVRHRHHIGYATLASTMADDAVGLFPELIRLKESEGLFQMAVGSLAVAQETGRDTVVASIQLPARAPPATYRVELFGFRDGRLVIRREGNVEIVRGRLNAVVADLVREYRLLYGLLAVAVAGGAGLFVGFAFGTVKGH